MTTQRRGRPRKMASGPLEDRYKELESRGWSALNIGRTLSDEFPDTAPDVRTIQRYVAADRSLDRSEPWRVSMTAPEDVPRVFEAIGAAVEASHGRIRWVSAAEAEWIVRISKLGEGVRMEPFAVFAQARRSARSDARDGSDYAEDIMLGVVTALLPDIDLGAAETLSEWITHGPRGRR